MSDQPPPAPPPPGPTPPPAPPPMPAGYAPLPPHAYAHWGRRVGAYLWDGVVALIPFFVVAAVGFVLFGAGSTTTTRLDGSESIQVHALGAAGIVVIVLALLGAAAFSIWNQFVRQGRTGWSLGKKALGIRLLSERTGQPIGGWMCFVRQLAHFFDGLCYVGYLWPLWDAKRQTFADKLVGTIVIPQDEPPAA